MSFDEWIAVQRWPWVDGHREEDEKYTIEQMRVAFEAGQAEGRRTLITDLYRTEPDPARVANITIKGYTLKP